MFPRWIQKADVLNLTVCIILMLVMIPLTVISVQKIRRKMKAKTWKSVQRWAYLFYALIPVHVIVLNLAKAQRGNTEVRVNLLLYLAVFLGYAVCRVHKWYIAKKNPARQIGVKLAAWGTFLIGIFVIAAAVFPQKPSVTERNTSAEIQAETTITEIAAVQTTTITALTYMTAAPIEKDSTSNNTTMTTETFADKTTGTDASADTTEASAQSVPTDSEDAPAQGEMTGQSTTESATNATAQREATTNSQRIGQSTTARQTETTSTQTLKTEPPAPVRIYQDGTFTATAYGYDGNITVHVTIQNDTITDITAETEESDDSYFFDAKSAVIPAIIRSQAADVDACSGATYSSNGIMAAVRAALEQARI